MEKVTSINAQDKNPLSTFGSLSRGVVGGAVTGYAAKYFLPLNKSEMNEEFYEHMARIRQLANETKGSTIREIRGIEKKTLAQDVFLKMVDESNPNLKSQNGNGLKKMIINAFADMPEAGEAGSNSKVAKNVNKMRNIIKNANLSDDDMKELKNIIAQVNNKAQRSYKQFTNAYKASVKRVKRPAIAYAIGGSIAGFFAGLAHKVITVKAGE